MINQLTVRNLAKSSYLRFKCCTRTWSLRQFCAFLGQRLRTIHISTPLIPKFSALFFENSQQDQRRRLGTIAYLLRSIPRRRWAHLRPPIWRWFSVVWAGLKFGWYPIGAQTSLLTDHDGLQWPLNLPDASGNLMLWLLWLPVVKIDVRHRPDIKAPTASLHLWLLNNRKVTSVLNIAFLILMIVQMDEAKTAEENYEKPLIVKDALRETALGLHAIFAIETTATPVIQLTTAKVPSKQAKDSLCRQLTSTIGAPSSDRSYNRDVFLICRAAIHVTVQKDVRQSSQICVLHAYHYLPLERLPAEPTMCDTMRCKVYWRPMAKDGYPSMTPVARHVHSTERKSLRRVT